jgi:hypothetical protein
MDSSFHPFSELFAQLGLPSDARSIDAFLDSHAPLDGRIALADAPFWNPSQAAMLREELLEDGDWAEVVDRLNEALRH